MSISRSYLIFQGGQKFMNENSPSCEIARDVQRTNERTIKNRSTFEITKIGKSGADNRRRRRRRCRRCCRHQ